MTTGARVDDVAEEYTLAFPAPGDPKSINELQGRHWGNRHRHGEPWRDEAYYIWKATRTGPAAAAMGRPCRVQVEIPFRSNRRRDPSNYTATVVKPIVDGLVLAGCWEDDTAEWVEIVDSKLVVYKLPPTTPLPVIVHLYPKVPA